jgi:hypothetical protein
MPCELLCTNKASGKKYTEDKCQHIKISFLDAAVNLNVLQSNIQYHMGAESLTAILSTSLECECEVPVVSQQQFLQQALLHRNGGAPF